MSIDERARFEVHQRLAEVLGEEAAVTLMSQLPPPASDLATREQVDDLERRMDVRFDAFDGASPSASNGLTSASRGSSRV